ncbi:MAG: UDP-N-acetylmuramoyl-L-alanine--D-glutamate ligase, partial [Actinomycetota bacterium]|nr:UDP-N-acetylmuramoyl-L-alanine--D-glutamate ligase [Actinomycetota bacterium]
MSVLDTLFAGQRVLVTGAGVAGRSVALALRGMGAHVTVTDAKADRLAELADTGIDVAVGLTEPPDGTDLVVTSPGWRPDSPVLAASAVEVIGDVELAWRMSEALSD